MGDFSHVKTESTFPKGEFGRWIPKPKRPAEGLNQKLHRSQSPKGAIIIQRRAKPWKQAPQRSALKGRHNSFSFAPTGLTSFSFYLPGLHPGLNRFAPSGHSPLSADPQPSVCLQPKTSRSRGRSRSHSRSRNPLRLSQKLRRSQRPPLHPLTLYNTISPG